MKFSLQRKSIRSVATLAVASLALALAALLIAAGGLIAAKDMIFAPRKER
jgi:hypothetical protein